MRAEQLGDLSEAAVVIATVGTTATTSVDPVPAIADACERAGTWLHVDAAYAGAAMVCPEYRWAFEGIDRADSLVVNAHKWMLTPMDCSLLWTRRPEDSAARVQPDPRVPAHAGRRGRAQPQRVRARARPPVSRAEAVGRAALLRPLRAAGPHPQRRRAGGTSSSGGWRPSPAGSCARRGNSRSSASGSRARRAQPRAARARQRRAARCSSPKRC